MDLAIVIPVYNEEKTIKGLIEDLNDVLKKEDINYSIFIINDGSTDSSLCLIEGIKKYIPNIQITSKTNSGHGPSILQGYHLAFNHQWVFQFDSDYQYSLDTFKKIWTLREQYDLLIAERTYRNASWPRRMVSFTLKYFVYFLYGKGINDINVPYRLIRTLLLKEALYSIPPRSFAPNTLVTAYFIKKHFRILLTSCEPKNNLDNRRSKMSSYILKGCIKSILDLIIFRFKI